MWTINELIVVSDLHLAPERNTGSFQLDKEFPECLRWLLAETHDCLVVLAGDIFDFLTVNDCPSKRGFDRLTCHLKRILEHHREIFDALTRVAHSSQHTLVFMTGEGDFEMVLPELQETVERRLGFAGPKGSVRWVMLGEALRVQVGDAVVLIEHGNTFDPWNRMDHASLQRVLSLASRNLPEPREQQQPLGRELTLRVINSMRSAHQWIDCLKPANESILPLLWPLASDKQRDVILELAGLYESLKTEAALKKLSNSHDPALLYEGQKEADRSPIDRTFKDWIDLIYADQKSAKASNEKLTEKIRLLSNRDSFFEIEQPNDTTKYLKPMFDGGADLVIHGHTHAAKICPTGDGLYLNTGAWGQLIQMPQSNEGDRAWEVFLEKLKTNTVDSFARPTLAHVYKQEESCPIGALVQWRSTGPQTLAARHLKTHALIKE